MRLEDRRDLHSGFAVVGDYSPTAKHLQQEAEARCCIDVVVGNEDAHVRCEVELGRRFHPILGPSCCQSRLDGLRGASLSFASPAERPMGASSALVRAEQ